MIRAVLKNGLIQPVDPLPPEWREGQPLVVDPAADATAPSELDRWYEEVKSASAAIPPDELARLDSALADADRQAKEAVRLQMGLRS